MLGNFFKRIGKGFARIFTREGRAERKELKAQYDETEIYNSLKVKEFYVTARGKNPPMKISYILENGKIVEKRELNVTLPSNHSPETKQLQGEKSLQSERQVGEKSSPSRTNKTRDTKQQVKGEDKEQPLPLAVEETKSSLSLKMIEKAVQNMTPEQKEQYDKLRGEAFKKLMDKAPKKVKKKVLKRGNSVKEDGESTSM